MLAFQVCTMCPIYAEMGIEPRTCWDQNSSTSANSSSPGIFFCLLKFMFASQIHHHHPHPNPCHCCKGRKGRSTYLVCLRAEPRGGPETIKNTFLCKVWAGSEGQCLSKATAPPMQVMPRRPLPFILLESVDGDWKLVSFPGASSR